MTPNTDQTCPECGVDFHAPVKDGLCGSNCRAIRAEIAHDKANPAVEFLSIEYVSGGISDAVLCAYPDVNSFDAMLEAIREACPANSAIVVHARLGLNDGTVFEFRPDQVGADVTVAGGPRSETIGTHFLNALGSHRRNGGAESAELADDYARALVALGVQVLYG